MYCSNWIWNSNIFSEKHAQNMVLLSVQSEEVLCSLCLKQICSSFAEENSIFTFKLLAVFIKYNVLDNVRKSFILLKCHHSKLLY